MNNFNLTVITENQAHRIKAEKLVEKIISIIGTDCLFKNIEKYTKFNNSYKLKFEIKLSDRINIIEQCIILANKISSPWLINSVEIGGNIDLIFNKNEFSKFRDKEFNVIKWAELTN